MTALMRVEIDLDNPDGVLRDGMFGRADIMLEKSIKNLTVPSSCLIDRNGKGDGAVLVVRDGKVRRVHVHVGMDTGLRAEIVDGITDHDQVILQPDPSIADGTARSGRIRGACTHGERMTARPSRIEFQAGGDVAEEDKDVSSPRSRSARGHGGPPMSRQSPCATAAPTLERLEHRLQLSAAIPANSIGTSRGR